MSPPVTQFWNQSDYVCLYLPYFFILFLFPFNFVNCLGIICRFHILCLFPAIVCRSSFLSSISGQFDCPLILLFIPLWFFAWDSWDSWDSSLRLSQLYQVSHVIFLQWDFGTMGLSKSLNLNSLISIFCMTILTVLTVSLPQFLQTVNMVNSVMSFFIIHPPSLADFVSCSYWFLVILNHYRGYPLCVTC